MENGLKEFFIDRGYREMATNNDHIKVVYMEDVVTVEVIVFHDNPSGMEFTKEQYDHILSQIKQSFLARGFGNAFVLSLICTKNAAAAKGCCMNSEYTSWIIDEQTNQLIIYENQRAGFKHVQNQIEAWLSNEEITSGRPLTRKQSWDKYPVITILLVLLNVILYILVEVTGFSEDSYHLYRWGATEYAAIFEQHEYYRLFSSMFLHAGPEHLINNMFTLIIIGGRLERLLGKYRYVIVYLLSGIFASTGSVLYNHWMGVDMVGVGASGAIFGCIGGLFYLICKYRGAGTEISRNQMLFFIGLSLYSGVANSSTVDNTAHIVGCIRGILLTCLVDLIVRKRIGRQK